jgi:hypothetical protein
LGSRSRPRCAPVPTRLSNSPPVSPKSAVRTSVGGAKPEAGRGQAGLLLSADAGRSSNDNRSAQIDPAADARYDEPRRTAMTRDAPAPTSTPELGIGPVEWQSVLVASPGDGKERRQPFPPTRIGGGNYSSL